MRKKSENFTKAFLALFLSVSMILTLFIGDSASAFITEFGSTQIFFNEEREIAKGVVLNDWLGRNPDGTPKLGHTITFNPKTSDAMILAAYGDNVNSRKTLSSTSALVEKQGVSIIGGINGDFYNLSTGVPIGLVIQDGRLVSCSPTKWNAIGFKEDGSVVIGSPKIDMKVMLNETEFHINNLNKAQDDWGPYLYSSDFGPNTGSTVPSLEVVMDIKIGELAAGKVITARVVEVRKDTKATPIKPNQLVFSARNNKYGHYTLSQFKVGDSLTIEIVDTTNQWMDVKQAIGGEKILISNGVIASGLAPKNYNPSSAIGVKANGDVVFYQCDGRNDASQGVSSLEIAQFLFNLGCTQAIQLDGGGSSAMIARRPGYRSPGLINIPSDGKERANANGIILVSKQSMAIKNGTAVSDPTAKKLHIYPGKTYALPNSTVQFSTLATNDYYFKTDVPTGIVWGSDAGAMDGTGKLTVNAKPGVYKVLAGGGSAIGTSELTIPSSISSIRPSKGIVQLTPGQSIDLSCEGYYQDIKVYSADSSFTWQVEGNIGTVTQEGVFTMAQGATGKGRIVIKYGNTSAYIDVIAPDSPNSLDDFENGLGWGSTSVRAHAAKVSVVQDAKLAKSGSNVLRIDYDFTLSAGIEKGVAGVYAYRLDPNTKAQTGIAVDKNPTHIGMWVYGDNSKTWIRGKMKDGSGQTFDIDFTPDYRTDTKIGGVDWTGWKYVEAAIPAGKVGPFTLETPIRIMCSRDEMRTKGTLYFDKIHAVYGGSAKDTLAPIVKITSPADKSVLTSGKAAFSVELSDGTGSGIDTKSIQVLLDGAAVPSVSTTANGVIALKGELGTALPMADGLHKLTVVSADLFGNRSTAEITFTVETGSPQFIIETTPTVAEGGNFTTTLNVKNPKNLKKAYLSLSYDPSKAELVDADAKTAGKQAALEAWVKKGKIIKHVIDEKAGTILLEIDNLTNLSSAALSKFATLTFKAKPAFQDSASVNLVLGAMITGKNTTGQRFTLPVQKTNMQFSLTLSVTGTSAGEETVFTLLNNKGMPVQGAGLYLNGAAEPLYYTDQAGQYKTKYMTLLEVGTQIRVRAKKDGVNSNELTFTITQKTTSQNTAGQTNTSQTTSTGTLLPQNLSLCLAAEPGSMAINFVTPLENAGTIVQYVEERAYTGSFSASSEIRGQDENVSLLNVDKTVPVRVHSALMTNLKPATAYVYRVGDSTGKFSTAGKFTTPGYDAPYSFVFVTDPQAVNESSYNVFGNVLKSAVSKAVNPAFILVGGDLADRGGNKGQWDLMFKVSAPIMASTPVMAAPGNHEYYDDPNLTNFTSLFNFPQNGPAGYGETAYSFTTKDALFMVLDTQKNLSKQMLWVEEVSKASNKKWKIVMMHRGIYSGFYDESEYRKVVAPAFDRAGIDLVLNGHDHTYLRTTMKAGTKVSPGSGTTYITGGSSAMKYYDAPARTWTQVLYDANNPVFTTFKVYADRISVVSAHLENGKTVDHDTFEIVKK